MLAVKPFMPKIRIMYSDIENQPVFYVSRLIFIKHTAEINDKMVLNYLFPPIHLLARKTPVMVRNLVVTKPPGNCAYAVKVFHTFLMPKKWVNA
ncbi:hypothetical protein [Virgibacillus kimchii]